MAVVRLTPTQGFVDSLRSIHKALSVDQSQTLIVQDNYGLALLRKSPNSALGFNSEPVARFNWNADTWTAVEKP